MDGPLGFFIPRAAKAKAKAVIEGGFRGLRNPLSKMPFGAVVQRGGLVSTITAEILDVYADPELMQAQAAAIEVRPRAPPAPHSCSQRAAAAPLTSTHPHSCSRLRHSHICG